MTVRTAEMVVTLRLNPYLRYGSPEETMNFRLDAEAAMKRMSQRARVGLLLRVAGLWAEEIGPRFGVSATTIRRDRGYLRLP